LLTSDSVLVEDRHLASLRACELIDVCPVHLEIHAPLAHDHLVDFMSVAQGGSDRLSRESSWGGM
jgi:hypothetical protein